MPKADSLIHTKLHPPYIRSDLVPRPRLHARILEGLRRPLTLITAPAGYGKTTLLASAIAEGGMPVAWLSLDKGDSEPGRFLSYLVAALAEIDPTLGGEAAQLLAVGRLPSPIEVLTSLINDLASAGRDLALVLDDYQFIRSHVVHDAMASLLDYCPTTFHLVIATRSDPPLPVTRLRVRGQVVELRAADLGFTEQEAAQFLNDIMGLGLDARSVAALEARTEGWIAGLQMAALSMRDRADVRGFIDGFSGTNRYILDYLMEEVLASQPPEIQRFLLHTSILERVTAPLCDAVLAEGSGPTSTDDRPPGDPESNLPGRSAVTLDLLDRSNLFLVPLDDARVWYRYHHLFADLLRTQLQRLLGAEGVAGLHLRASEWWARHGSLLEAIYHASAAADEERVERLIERHYRELVSRGEMAGYRFWTGALSQELVRNRPWLCIYEAYSHAWFGELDPADRLLEAAERHLQSAEPTPDARAMASHLAYVKSRVTAMRGDIDRAIEYCLVAREQLPPGNLALAFDTWVTLGYETLMSGDLTKAEQILDAAIRASMEAGAVIYTVAASCFLARLYVIQGRLDQAYATYERAASAISEAGSEHRDARALVAVGLADILCERNDLDAALDHVAQGLAGIPFWGKADDGALACLTLARIHLAQADTSAAATAVEKALDQIQTHSVFPDVRQAVEVAQVRLWLAQGDLESAGRWGATLERQGSDRLRFEDEPAQITRARLMLARQRPAAAIALLLQLEANARSAGRMGRVIEILALKSLAMGAMGDSEPALRTLTECLTLAEPEGYARVFLDEGPAMQALLARWVAQAGPGGPRDYGGRLLSQFEAERTTVPAAEHAVSPPSELIDPLSERELEVLRLVAEGMTNREIARQLIVATGTIKAHTANIYRKLDVRNRTEAVARARQLGILP